MWNLSKSLRIVSIAAALAMFAGVSAEAATAMAQQHPRRADVHHRLTAQTHAKQRLHRHGTARAQARGLQKQDRTMRQEKSHKTSENGGRVPSAPHETAAGGGTEK
jgi:Ni/Co efflux regulator RcnB